jgi:moderate conductance mechanosensitive channel
MTLVVTCIVSILTKQAIDLGVAGVKSRFASHDSLLARTRTIRTLLKSIIDVVVWTAAVLIILAHWDVNILPLLTGAGIAGLALSFGAQTLVKDIISGFFIILEDQFSVGDLVKIGTIEGRVERVTLRLTILRDEDDNLVYIPNSQILTVVRYVGKIPRKKK